MKLYRFLGKYLLNEIIGIFWKVLRKVQNFSLENFIDILELSRPQEVEEKELSSLETNIFV